MLTVLEHVVQALEFNSAQTQAACTSDLLATQHALDQGADGVPFRTAYRHIAEANSSSEALEPAAVLEAYHTPGNSGQERPAVVRARLDEHRDWIANG